MNHVLMAVLIVMDLGWIGWKAMRADAIRIVIPVYTLFSAIIVLLLASLSLRGHPAPPWPGVVHRGHPNEDRRP